MAGYKALMPSDQDYILRYIDELLDNAESDCEFEGYLEVDEWLVTSSSHHDYGLQRLPSLDRLGEEKDEYPLALGCTTDLLPI